MSPTDRRRRQIEYVTAEQRARLFERLKVWDIRVAVPPIDREAVASIVRRLYASIGRRPPDAIVWCDSPLSLTLTREIVTRRTIGPDVGLAVRARVHEDITSRICARMNSKVRSDELNGHGMPPR